MTSNTKRLAGAVIIIIVIAVAAFAIFHKSSNDNSTNTTNTTANQNTKPAVNNSVVLTKTDPSLGQYLTDPSGRALYTYNADTSGVSNCTGSCLANWPAYTANSTAANLPAGITTLRRSDTGAMQYAYNGMPLYYFTSDSGTQVTGNGVEDFQVAKPTASQNTDSQQSQPAETNGSGSYSY